MGAGFTAGYPADARRGIDWAYRMGYRCAYQLLRLYWRAAHPNTHGALVAVWWQDQILLVRQSYVPYLSLPGGYIRRGETSPQAAARELHEEIGVSASPLQLRPVLDKHHDWHGKRDHVEIFELDLAEAPRLTIDNREVVDAAFFAPRDALELDVFPLIRDVIARRLARSAPPRSDS